LSPLLCIVSFRCYMFCLLFVLVKYLPSDWLERLLWGSLIVARPRGDRLQKAQAEECVIGLLYCFIVLSCICLLSLRDYNYFPTFMARYGLFMLKVPLNPKQASKQTNVTEKAVVCKMLLKTVWHTWLSGLLFFVHRHLLHFHRTEQTATRIKLTDPIKVFRTWQWRREGGGGKGERPPREAVCRGRRHLRGEHLEILAFALQCVSVSLYLFLIYSVHWGGCCRLEARHADLCPGRQKPSRRHWILMM